MSMKLVLVKVSEGTRSLVVDTRGDLLTEILRRARSHDGFDRLADVYDALDYRDIALQAEDEEDPVSLLFQGPPLLAGYEWTYGPPAWFDPGETRRLFDALEDGADFWPFTDLVGFLGAAVREGKGVIVGVS